MRFTLELTTGLDPADGAWVVLEAPKLDLAYAALGGGSSASLFSSSASGTVDGYSTTGTRTLGVTVDEAEHGADGSTDYDRFAMELASGSPEILAGATITVVISGVTMPFSTSPYNNFVVYTGVGADAANIAKGETAKDGTNEGGTSDTDQPSLALSSIITTTAGAASGTIAFLDGLDGISKENANYGFTYRAANPIPDTAGLLVITVPDGVTVPGASASTLALTCNSGCADSGASMAYASGSRELTITGLFTSYVDAGETLDFEILGWTNPSSTATVTFAVASKWEDPDDSTIYDIDYYTGLNLNAVEGVCTISSIYPTDGNTMIFATPSNYTVVMLCAHEILPTYGI